MHPAAAIAAAPLALHQDGPGGAAPASVAPRDHEGAARLARRRVLLVDDNAINRLVARRILERLGYEPEEAVDGRQAVERVRPGRYAAILMDLQMPVMDGFDAARAIRASLQGQAPPILALTANVGPAERARARDSGMVEHLGKPVDIARLRAALARWIPDPDGPQA